MAWNEPGGNRNDKDPWGGGNRGNDQGPPDLDEALKKGMEKLNKLFGGKPSGSGNPGSGGDGNGSGAAMGGIFVIVIIGLLILLAFESVYTVDERERAVVLRFGKYAETLGPGLQFKLPLIDRVEKVDVTRVRSASTRGHMLTEDENIVEINLAVQYVVKDPKAFVLDIRNAERTLDYATDAALRHEVGSAELHQVLTEGRSVLAVRTQERLQKSMDFYHSGLQVSKVNIESTQAPAEVQDAFQDVQRAKEDEQRVKAEAEAYRNKVVPEARGMAQRILEEASAYKEEVIARAKGDTSRFLKLLSVYEQAPSVTRERLYIDTMQRVMSNSSKVLVDVEGGNNMMYLPLDKMMSATPATSGLPSVSGSSVSGRLSSDEIGSLTDRVLQELRVRQSESTTRRGRE
ncbi:FtsH protease activity modulator HflK [Alkalimarinus sediminis]|uniref:Protein HflK n=1 Tax=Alkalimarinus sediminis TaxID=1632866 RepID=A0A9E8KN72_9ALTE|nr:FtsH protease activity modulator HflK [Alkalimarinus sediminis]UZW74093.1 FtsH protease activity modulator HflK [Alkalimarinus sediminis]